MKRSNVGIEDAAGVAVQERVSSDPAREPAQEPPDDSAEAVPTTYGAHRLRDLDRRGRAVAALFALALAAIPVVAFAQMAPVWAPEGDPALMALRSLDVGTSRSPVLGQPSTSRFYVEGLPTVSHPGPAHFFLMAGPIRLFGAALGMLLVSLFVSASCLLASAWGAFRQLGPSGGVLASVILGAITFTLGVSSLMNPVSSSFAGYPVFCSMVLLWCLLAGDLKLLPLAALVVAFAAQQHLSSTPVLFLAAAFVGVTVGRRVVRQWRAEPASRPGLRRLVLGAGAIGLVLWAPILFQQVAGRGPGNLTALVEFSGDDDRPTLGFDMGLRQLAHVLGLPPLLGRTNIDGYSLLEPVGVVGWVTAAVVFAATVVVGVTSWRKDRARTALAAMALLLVAGGLFNGASVPDGIEMGRLAFYHWAWPLTFFVLLGLGVAGYARVSRFSWARAGWARPAALAVALAAIVVPVGINPSLDRWSNSTFAANAALHRDDLDQMVDAVLAERDDLGDQTVVLDRGGYLYLGFGHGLTLALIEEGVDVGISPHHGKGAHPHRMVDRDDLDSALVLVITDGIDPDGHEIPGELLAVVDTADFDTDSFVEVVGAFEDADEVVLGDELDQAIDDLATEEETLVARAGFDQLAEDPSDVLTRNMLVLELLRDHPPEQPRLDPDMVDRLLRSHEAAADEDETEQGYLLQLYLLDREQLLAFGTPGEIGS